MKPEFQRGLQAHPLGQKAQRRIKRSNISLIISDAARITLLTDRIAARETAITTLTTRNVELTDLIIGHETRMAELTTRNTELADLVTDHETRISELAARNVELTDLVTEHETRAAELSTRNDELAAVVTDHETRSVELSTRNTELADLVTGHETRITELTDRNVILTDQRAGFEAELTALQESCEPGEGVSLNYIHADHLGRPVFVTDPAGAVIWDAGITTPFGQSYEAQDLGDTVQTMAAITQPLMFPGQYRDEETGYDDNWHRTYDPALGRYLQSDPIGLAGGLNRYAYVGGNPVGYVDPMGLSMEPNHLAGGFVLSWQVGMESHKILETLALANVGWRANRSTGINGLCKFNGRPDLIHDTGRTVYELKPHSPSAIAVGELQVKRYVGRSISDAVRGINNPSPYRVGLVSPTTEGFRGLDRPHTGKYGVYTYQFVGNGVIGYTFQPHAGISTIKVPWVLPGCDYCKSSSDNPLLERLGGVY